MKNLLSRDIFKAFEASAREWGRQYQIAKIGDIVTTKRGSRTIRVMISRVSVTVGRNARITTRKTLVLEYVGRRMKKDGSFIDDVGVGLCLTNFETVDGRRFDASENGVTETANDVGLSFDIAVDSKAKRKYPKAFDSYTRCSYPYNR